MEQHAKDPQRLHSTGHRTLELNVIIMVYPYEHLATRLESQGLGRKLNNGQEWRDRT